MRNFLFLILSALIAGFATGCYRASQKIGDEGTTKDTLWYIDSIYIHRMGYSYVPGDSTFDRILVFKTDEIGDIVQVDDITDSVTFHLIYDYTYSPDSIIKHTFIDDFEEEAYYSVYELNDRGCIVKLTQHLDEYLVETEYSYDMEKHLSMIYFKESDTHCKWLWRDGNLERIVWGKGMHITEFRYNEDRNIPFTFVFTILPKLDILLSRLGYFGKQPEKAIFLTGETVNEDLVGVEAMYYERGYPGFAVRQMCYQGMDYDSIEYNIHWNNFIN